MTTVRKVIGRLPVLIGDWDSNYREGQGYMKNNRVLIFNSECQSKIDNNTYPPATQNLQTGVITFDTTHWVVVSDGRNTIGLAEHIQDKSNPHNVTKSQVGLSNVENKSSSDIRGELTSSNVTSALGYTPINQNEKGANSGVATLGADGKVPSTQLPSYVDDVLEYATMSAFPATGESGKIYVDLSTDRTYRWSGTQYTPIKGDLAIGSTTGTAADGGIVNTHVTDSTIHVTSTEKQTWNNKQKALAEGRGITITTGAAADTVSLNLPIHAGSGVDSLRGTNTTASGSYSHSEGFVTIASGSFSHTEGRNTEASGYTSHAEGNCTIASNESEHASGQYNVSNKASTTFGDGGNTLFSVGNGTADNAKHNAFEIRQNGDIYITNGGQDVKLQDTLGNKVDKTTTVNGHALSGNVAVTASDVGLGNVVNTGDSDTPVSGGTTKFTTGGAYTELAKKADIDNDGHVSAEQLENDYPDLTAGNIVGEFTQQAEFSYRPSAGTVDVKSGYKVDHGGKVMGVKGNTVAWNQLIREEFVDMGLPSGKLWAKKNLDVTQPSGFAASEYQYECSFFSWGNTDGHNPNAQDAFDYDFGSSNDGPYASTTGAALTGDIGVANDAARFNGGAPWRLPTTEEYAELFSHITYIDANGDDIPVAQGNKLTTVNGVTGLLLKSNVNGKTLFFPCSGSGYGSSWNGRGGYGNYWASSLSSQTVGRELGFYSGGVSPQNDNSRFYGFTARPILTPGLNTDGDGHKYYTSPTTGTAYDLTLIYGAGNEPETAEEFEEDYFKWFGKPLSYEAYDEGSLRSVKMTGLKTVGFNLFDENVMTTWEGVTKTSKGWSGEVVKFFNGKTYWTNNINYSGQICIRMKASADRVGINFRLQFVYDDGTNSPADTLSGTSIDSYALSNPNKKIRYINSDFDNGGNITIEELCINLHHSGAKDGDYESYWESQMDFDVTKVYGKLNGEGSLVQVFPNGMKSADYAGTVRDLLSLKDRTADVKVSDTAATAGTALYEALATPLHYTDCVYRDNGVDTPLDQMGEYDVDDWGTEEVTVPAGVASVAPVLDLKYGLNAADTLKNLPDNYVSVNAQTLTSDQQERVKRNLGLTNPSSIGIDSEVQTITANTSVTIPTGNWVSKTIVFANGGSSDLTVTVPTSGVQTPDGQAIELTCPVGGYCEVNLLKIGSTIYARGI